MTSYDIFGVGIIVGMTGLAVDQGWTWYLVGATGWCVFCFVRQWIRDDRKAKGT